MLSDAKRPDEAVAELQAATRLEPRSMKAWWRLGVVYLRKNQVKEALDALQRARAIKPIKEVWTDLGLAQRKQGDRGQAEASFRAALQQDGRYYPAWIYLADTIADGGRCKEALKDLEVVPLDDEFREAVHRVQAKCQFARGK
jgi:cytochrome c-type biogenesis protein CcmH/NrfG